MTMTSAVINVYDNAEAVAAAAAEYLLQQISLCVAEEGVCHVALPGGTTPAHCLALLAQMSLPWQQIHWYPGDERCYPRAHPARNDSMIREKLFSTIDPAETNFHPIPAELGPEAGAEQYAKLIDSLPGLDIVVLGMGEDGHTASLFPDNPALKDERSVVPVYQAPKPPPERISLGLNTLRNAGQRIVIATSSGKRDALARLQAGEALPVALVEPDTWFIDKAARPDKA